MKGNKYALLMSITFLLNYHLIYPQSVEPLITAQWGQDFPYNAYSPAFTPPGCVAVAVGQVMRYYKYPARGIGSYSYTTKYGKLEYDFSTASFLWDSMPSKITIFNDSVETNSITNLLYEIAIADSADFQDSGTGMDIFNRGLYLVNNFGYSPSIQPVYQSSFNLDQWRLLLKGQLDKKRPILLSSKLENRPEHMIIIDGYKYVNNQLKFHCNFGWSGYLDGYYAIDSINADNVKFIGNQSAIINMVPPKLPKPQNVKITYTQDNKYVFTWDPIISDSLQWYQIIFVTAPAIPYYEQGNFLTRMFSDTISKSVARYEYSLPSHLASVDSIYFWLAGIDKDSIFGFCSDLNVIRKSSMPIKQMLSNLCKSDLMSFRINNVRSQISLTSSKTLKVNQIEIKLYNLNGKLLEKGYFSDGAFYEYHISHNIITIAKIYINNYDFYSRIFKS